MTDMGSVSDGYHTFDELYEHRTALFAALCRLRPDISWRSERHHVGGTDMYPGMFIVGMDLPAGQVTYHCEADTWDLFRGVPVRANAPVWDGHSPSDVVTRVNAWDRGAS